jgi:hypothetical protein
MHSDQSLHRLLDEIAAMTWTPSSGAGITSSPYSIPPYGAASSGKISLTGDDADIEINGESIVGLLKDIREQLALLKVSQELEAEWSELRDLRTQYETKLAECRQKSQAWQALQQSG